MVLARVALWQHRGSRRTLLVDLLLAAERNLPPRRDLGMPLSPKRSSLRRWLASTPAAFSRLCMPQASAICSTPCGHHRRTAELFCRVLGYLPKAARCGAVLLIVSCWSGHSTYVERRRATPGKCFNSHSHRSRADAETLAASLHRSLHSSNGQEDHVRHRLSLGRLVGAAAGPTFCMR